MYSDGVSGSLYSAYKGVGSGINGSSLPPQALPLHKKGKKWKKINMDRLEEIGLQQIRRNALFNDLYSMVEGNLIATDYEAPPEALRNITDMLEAEDIPVTVRHYDVLGLLGNYLSGKYNDTKDKFRVDFFDSVASNEFTRELNNRIHDFAKRSFELEFQLIMLKKGIDINKQFETEEEQAEYIAYLEEQKKNISTPPDIYNYMTREWKPLAAKWAQKTLEKDAQRFRIDEMDRKFFIDRYLTGRYFKHYRIGYDYYEPVRWHPSTVFFSEDLDTIYPQNGEYIGRIHYLSPSDIVNLYGYMLTESEQKTLLNAFEYDYGEEDSAPTFEKMMEKNFIEREVTPHPDFYDRETNVALQGALGIPFGEQTYVNSKGELAVRPSWIPSYFDAPAQDNYYAVSLRRDIKVRRDLIRTTEAYWRSYERIGILYYETDYGFLTKEIVTDDILDDFLKEKGIKTLQNISLFELEKREKAGTLEPNIIAFTYAPRVYKGLKISAQNTKLKKDLYLGVEPLPFQIKGDSNLYNVQLPVAGIITNSIANKLKDFQKEYNYQMNLIRSLTEKEIGLFYLFDINLLTSDLADGDSREAMLNVLEMARNVGIVPIDTSKQNQRDKQGVQYNAMTAQSITFIPEIQNKMQVAEFYFNKMLQQIGITHQDLGTPSEYMTAEGVKMSHQNTFSQIEHIFEEMDTARLKDMEIHLAVAQYCQTNNKDISVRYTADDSQLQLLNFSDEWFHHRKFGLLPISNPRKKKELTEFKQFLLSTNTFQNDFTDFAKVITSDSMVEVINELKQAQLEQQERLQEDRAFQERLVEKQNEGALQVEQMRQEHESREKDLDRKSQEKQKLIQAYGYSVGREGTETSDLNRMDKIAQQEIQRDKNAKDYEIKALKEQHENESRKRKEALEERRIALEEEKLRVRKEEAQSKNFRSIINKN